MSAEDDDTELGTVALSDKVTMDLKSITSSVKRHSFINKLNTVGSTSLEGPATFEETDLDKELGNNGTEFDSNTAEGTAKPEKDGGISQD